MRLFSTIRITETRDADEYRWGFYPHERILDPTQQRSKVVIIGEARITSLPAV